MKLCLQASRLFVVLVVLLSLLAGLRARKQLTSLVLKPLPGWSTPTSRNSYCILQQHGAASDFSSKDPKFILAFKQRDVASSQNQGPILVALNIRCRNVTYNQKRAQNFGNPPFRHSSRPRILNTAWATLSPSLPPSWDHAEWGGFWFLVGILINLALFDSNHT